MLLITIDTLRADRVGAYGYPLGTTRTIDRLAKRGVRFADVTVPWPKTWPSMASMVTGKYPWTNGITLMPRRPLPAENVTLAEVLRDSGYATGAVVANLSLGRSFAFDQGFDYFVESWAEEASRRIGKAGFPRVPGAAKQFTNATLVTNQGIAAIDALGKGDTRPFFVWLHYIDPHGPYIPPRAYEKLVARQHPVERVPVEEIPSYQLQLDPASGQISNDLGFYAAQYDRAIRYLDDQIARLFQALEERGAMRNTLIVFTADHGESLNENRYYLEHGRVPYQTDAAIPMIFVLDGRLPAGRVVETPVGLLDLLPTILGLTATPLPDGVQGVSLVPLLEGSGEPVARYVFMESGNVEPSQLTVRKGPWKLVRLRSPADRAWLGRKEFELYDISRDPHEQTDVREQNPEIAAELTAALETWQRDTPRLRADSETDLHQLDEHSQQMLRDLGYLE